jgi:Ca2+-binding RTX toxin-like protein
MAVWLGVEWFGNGNANNKVNGVAANVAVNVSGLGDGSVAINTGTLVTDSLAGVELLAFDNGIWSVVTNEWVPMISVRNPTIDDAEPMLVLDDRALNGDPQVGQVLDGNQVSSFQLLDNTLIPTGGIRVGQIDIVDADGVRGIQAVTIAGVDAAAFQIRTEPGGVQGLYFVGANVAGARTNYEIKGHYDITLNVADNSGGSSMNYTLKVVDVNDNAPLLTSPEKVHLYSNLDPGTVIYRGTATDLDTSTAVNQTALQYSLWAGPGNNNNLFSLTDNGEVRFAGPPTPGNYKLGIQVFDGVHTVEKMVDVVVGGPVVQLTFNDPVLDEDTGAFNNDFITSNGNVVLSGTYDVAAPVASIVLMNGNMLIDEATLNPGAGTWSFDGDLPPGIYAALKAVARDVNGATLGQASSPNGIAVDKNAVGAITITSIAGDNMISQAEAGGIVSIVGTVTGEIANGSTVSLLINGQNFDGTTQGNSFVINVGAAHLIADVDRTVQASVNFTDLAGNAGVANAQRTFVVDITPPAAALVQINDGDGQIDPSEAVNLGFGVSGVEAGATATVTFTSSGGGAPVVLSGLGNGAFSANLSGLGLGTINAAITTIDGAGNTTAGTGDISTKISVVPGLVLDGGSKSDSLTGGEGNDNIDGKGGADTLRGLGGNDELKGGKGKDLLEGGNGDDVLIGGKGKDKLYGGDGNDQLNGGKGKDLLDGGLGDDFLLGGGGKDVFVFKTGYGNDVVGDYQAGKDLFDLRGTDVDSFKELKAIMTESSSDVFIDFGNGDSLTLLDTSIKVLQQHKADFDFA